MEHETPKEMLERIVKEALEAAREAEQNIAKGQNLMTDEEIKEWTERLMKDRRQGIGSRYT